VYNLLFCDPLMCITSKGSTCQLALSHIDIMVFVQVSILWYCCSCLPIVPRKSSIIF